MSIEWFNEAVEAVRRVQRGDYEGARPDKEWFEQQVENIRDRSREMGQEIEDPAKSLRETLGFFSAMFDQETAELVWEWYGAAHPFFGPPAERAKLTPHQIFEMGQAAGRATALQQDVGVITAAMEMTWTVLQELERTLTGEALEKVKGLRATISEVLTSRPAAQEPERPKLIKTDLNN